MDDRTTSDDILQMRRITKTFPGVKALEDVSLNVRRGEIHAICGENGAGKSTLIKILSGAEHPDTGTIAIGAHAAGNSARAWPTNASASPT